MKCPYCGKDMVAGELKNQQGSMIYWQPIQDGLPKARISEASVKKHGGIVLAHAQSLLSEANRAHMCKECKKCIVSFE